MTLAGGPAPQAPRDIFEPVKWGAVLAIWALPVWADPGILEIVAGEDRLQLAPEQIVVVELQSVIGGAQVVVTLDPALAEALRVFSAAHVREEAAIRVCGDVVSRPEISAEIPGGIFAIQGDSYLTAKHLAAVLTAKDCALQPSS